MKNIKEKIIEVKNLKKNFKISKRMNGLPGHIANLFKPKYEVKEAVKGIDFEIYEGECVGFIGANGAGKSTTIKMLSGILYPDSGCINVMGFEPHKDRKKYVANIGVVFGQKSQLSWDLPVIDSFFDCMTLGILGTFQRVYKCQGPERCGGLLVVVGCDLWFVKQLCTKEKQEEKEIRYPDSEDQTCPKELNAPNQQEVV